MTSRRERTRLVIVYYFYRKRVNQCFVFSLRNKREKCIDSPDQLFVIHIIVLQNAAAIFDRDAAGLFNIIVQNLLILY